MHIQIYNQIEITQFKPNNTQYPLVSFYETVREHTNSLDHDKGLHSQNKNVSLQQICIMGMNAVGEDPGKHTQRALRL